MQSHEVYQLTNPQKSIWFTEQYYKGTTVNNICGSVLIEQKVNIDLLNTAINKFIENNDSFRTKLKLIDGIVYQYFTEDSNYNFEHLNLQDSSEIETHAKQMVSIPFEMIDSKLFDFKLFTLANGYGGFIVNAHHLISDAATFSFIATEVTSNYSMLLKNEPIPKKEYSYIDYIKSEKDYLSSKRFEKDKTYWNELLSSLPEPATIPTLKNNEPDSCEADRKECFFDNEYMKKINAFCKNHNISIYNFLIAIYSFYIGRVNNFSNFLIGTPILNRTTFAEKHTSGMYISTSILNININNDLTFAEFSQEIAKSTISLLRHQKYNYQYIIDNLRKKDKTIPNLYNIMLSYQITKATDSNSEIQYESKWYANNCISDDIDIHFHDNDNTGNLLVEYDYKKCKYTNKDMEDIHKRILHVINQILSNENTNLKDIEIVTEEERNEILFDFNNTSTDYPKDKTIIQLFEEQVAKTPNNIAVVYGDKKLTYKELSILSNKLCNHLINNNIKPNDRICLYFNNSIELVVSILGVLKCGCCYIPIDVNYPFERISYIFNNSNSKKILSNSKHSYKLAEFSECVLNIDLEDIAKIENSSFDNSNIKASAYIIYTSGSTGNPKGVEISHYNLTNYIYYSKKTYVGNEVTNFPLYSSISFDLTVTSIFTPIISGYSIYIYEDENPQLLLQKIISDGKVQIIKLTPAHLILLCDCIKGKSSVNKLIVGGDILSTEISKKLSKAFNNNIKIYNEYGPTEATVGCMIYEYNENDNYSSVPIGVPIDNTNIYILDDNLNLLPYGSLGEIFISGNGICKGYINNKDLTAEKFINNPYQENQKLYKTGDIAKMYPNGIIEYIGRSDFQVKINGFRIELGEIQSKILTYPGIKDCYVTVVEMDNSKAICAYYVSNETIDISNIKHFLSTYLPTYMIPKYYIPLDVIPLTINGKPNKSLLPLPIANNTNTFIAPKTKLQKIIHDVMCQILDISKMSITTDFFDYFIDSLAIIKAQAILYSKGYNVNTQAFYEYSNIQDLEKHIISENSRNIINDSDETDIDLINIKDIQYSLNKNFSNYKNILLFGATGFLGIHILYDLIINTNYNVYCIIREKDNLSPVQRITELMRFYFKDMNIKKYLNRIHIIKGDLSIDRFSLSNNKYNTLGKIIDCVIDSAAIVKHYGDYKLFYDINVLGTERLIEFCTKHKIPLHHISTLSVSGYGLVKTPDCVFSESDFYVGQNYMDNTYVRSKFEAEKLIYDACKNDNLIATIYRVGNITNRFLDGFFQKNYSDNAFINRLTAFINLRMCTKRNY